MLNIFRRREMVVRIFVGSMLVLVAVTMVITLIPGITGTTTDPTVGGVVAEVAGEEITTWELQQNVLQVSRTNRIPAEILPLYTSQILDQMVLERATLREARRLGLRVSPSDLTARLRLNPDFFPGGKFVGQEQYENLILERFGITVPQFEQRFQNVLLTEKLRQLVTDSLSVTPEEIRAEFNNINEKVILSYVFVEPASFRKDISATDAVLESYYQKNKTRYQVPEKRSVKILLIENQKVRQTTAVTDAEVRKYYEDHKDSYRVEERVQVSHILLKAPESDKAKMEQARKKAEDLIQKLKAGADFAELAKVNSEDMASAVKGGDLGWIVRKQTVPEFEKSAFSLASGTISDAVQTVYGIHILKVIAHEQARLRPVEEVKAEIENLLREEKLQSALTGFGDRAVADLRRSPSDIEALAAKYQGVVLSPPPFTQDETVPRMDPQQAFLQEVFSLEKGQVGQPIPVTDGYAIAHLLDVLPAHQGELAEVKERVREDYVQEQAREKAAAIGQELAKVLGGQEKKDLEKAAKALGLTAKKSDPLTREGTIPSLGTVRELGASVFTMPAGEVAGPVAMAEGQIVYQLQSRESPKEEDLATQKDLIEQRLLSEKQNLAFESFQDSLKSRLTASGDLTIHNDVLDSLTATFRPAP